MSEQQWVYAKDKLPDASGKLTKIREWTNRNVNVVCWLAIPHPPKRTDENE